MVFIKNAVALIFMLALGVGVELLLEILKETNHWGLYAIVAIAIIIIGCLVL